MPRPRVGPRSRRPVGKRLADNVIRLVVVGDEHRCQAGLVSSFAAYLSAEPPRRRNKSRLPLVVEESDDEDDISDELGGSGYDAIGRRVCVREVASRFFDEAADEYDALSEMPESLRSHVSRCDGAVIVVGGEIEAARRWRRVLRVIKSACPCLLVVVDKGDELDEDEVSFFAQDIGMVAWRSVTDAPPPLEQYEVLDVFGTILDFVSATLGAEAFDSMIRDAAAPTVAADDDSSNSAFGISCAAAAENSGCSVA